MRDSVLTARAIPQVTSVRRQRSCGERGARFCDPLLPGQPEVRQAIAAVRRRFHASLEDLLLAWVERTQLRPLVPSADVVLTIVAVYELALRQALLDGTPPGSAERGLGAVLPRLVGALIEPGPP